MHKNRFNLDLDGNFLTEELDEDAEYAKQTEGFIDDESDDITWDGDELVYDEEAFYDEEDSGDYE